MARAEALPPELDGLASEVTIHLPWGSLLRGVLTAEYAFAGGVARVTRVGATVTALLSVTEREQSHGLPQLATIDLKTLAARYGQAGLALIDWRPATQADVDAARSSWARRLGIPDRRPAWLLRLRRPDVTVPVGPIRWQGMTTAR